MIGRDPRVYYYVHKGVESDLIYDFQSVIGLSQKHHRVRKIRALPYGCLEACGA